MSDKNLIGRALILTVISILILCGTTLGQEQVGSIVTELPQPDIPQPQMFCGYCHVLTYPNIVQKGYELWKKGKHNKFGCVECHYPPKGMKSLYEPKASGVEEPVTHIPKNPPDRFSYLKLGGNSVQTRPRVVDASCMTSNCHSRPDDKFKTKKIKFTEKVPFVHEPHLDEKKQIEGQKINCTSCHQHETEAKKFEVSKQSCHLCHFTNVKFNEGRGRCELCHELPKKPIQTSGQQPITHEMLKNEKVSCGSCHYEMIQAPGRAKYEAYFENGVLKAALVLGAGNTKRENCLSCHDQPKSLKEWANKKLMHEKHVTVKTARCFDCHQPIIHKKADAKETSIESPPKEKPTHALHEKLMRNQFLIDSCTACHPEPHRLQSILRVGEKRKGVPKTPGFHFIAKANCMACHQEAGVTKKGEKILKASAKTCVACHKGRENLLQEWKKELDDVMQETREIEKEALDALAEVEARLTPEKVSEAKKMLQEGKETFNLVQFGNGVHNKKYAMYLLDAAMTSYEDLLDYLEDAD